MRINHTFSPIWNGIFIVFVLWSCTKDGLLFSTINTDSITLKEVEVEDVLFDTDKSIITLTVPYGKSLTALSLVFAIEGGGESIPAIGSTQNFSQPVFYTIIHPSGGKRIYQVVVVNGDQPDPTISSLSRTELIAGESLLVNGTNFGRFGLAVKAALLNNEQFIANVPVKLLNENLVEVVVPDTIAPALYKVSIAVNNRSAISEKEIMVKYPSPIINGISSFNVLQGDTIWVNGRFFDQNIYDYDLIMRLAGQEIPINAFKNVNIGPKGTLGFVIPAGIKAGTYTFLIRNTTLNRASAVFELPLTIYNSKMPFVKEFVSNKSVFQKGESVAFTTVNFSESQARFFQVLFKKGNTTIAQNGIYDSSTKILSVELPIDMESGFYQISFYLSQPSLNYEYSFDTDLHITVQ